MEKRGNLATRLVTMTNFQLPGDVYALRRLGVESWQENFYWPVNDIAFTEMLDRVWHLFDATHESLDEEGRDLLLSDTSFIGILIQHLHLSLASKRSEEEGGTLLSGPLSEKTLNPDWRVIGKALSVTPSVDEKLRFTFRQVLKNFLYNKETHTLARISGALKQSKTWSLGSHSTLKESYHTMHGLCSDHKYIQTLVPNGLSQKGNSQWYSVIKALVVAIDRLSRDQGGVRLDVDAVTDCFYSRITSLAALYFHMAETHNQPDILLLTEVARPHHKAIALGLRASGTHIVGFHHGNDVCNYWERAAGYTEYAHCDEYVCPTSEIARNHAIEYSYCGICSERPVKFGDVASSYYKDIVAESGTETRADQINYVMIVGYPMRPYRFQYSRGGYYLFQIDLERRLISQLSAAGYSVIYKAHPDLLDEARIVTSGLPVSVLTERFETVWQQADAIIFGSTATTTFGFSVCTNAPLIVFDIEGQEWNPEAKELLNKRCRFIRSWFDERNRLQFDLDELLVALKQPFTSVDQSYVKKFMIPETSEKTPTAEPLLPL